MQAIVHLRDDSIELEICEKQMQQGFETLANAVARIKNEKLYRTAGYATFEEYCEKRWNWSRQRGYQIAGASVTISSLPEEKRALISTEKQARALAAVPEEEREEVLDAAVETGKVTPRSITEAAQKVVAPKPEKTIHLDKTGWPIPDSIYPDWQSAEALKSLLGNLQSVKLDVEHALENKELAFREVTNTTLANLKNAWSDLQRVLPYAVCPTCQGHNRDNCTLCKKRGFISKFGYDTWVPQELKEIREKGK